MSAHLAARRRHLAAKGRGLNLTRVVDGSQVNLGVQGFAYPTRIESPGLGEARQNDVTVQILNDEIAASESWPGPPQRGDVINLYGDRWAVLSSNPVYDGDLLIGHTLTCRGGK